MVTGEGSGPGKMWRMMKEITFIKQEDVIKVTIRKKKIYVINEQKSTNKK